MFLHAHAVLQRALFGVRLGPLLRAERNTAGEVPRGSRQEAAPLPGAVWRCRACRQAAHQDLHSAAMCLGHAFASGSRHSAVCQSCRWPGLLGGSDGLQSPASLRTRWHMVTPCVPLEGAFPSFLPFSSKVPVLRLLGNTPSAWSLPRIPRPAPGRPPCALGPSVTPVLVLRATGSLVAVPAGTRVSPGAGRSALPVASAPGEWWRCTLRPRAG